MILEGPDRVGKDTLAQALVQGWPDEHWLHVHNGSPPQLPGKGTLSWCHRQFAKQMTTLGGLSMDGWNVVVNRMHLSEFVYGTAFRGYDARAVFSAEAHAPSFGVGLLVVLNGDPAGLWKRQREDKRGHIQREIDMARVCALYDVAWHQSRLRKLYVDTRGLDARGVLALTRAWLEDPRADKSVGLVDLAAMEVAQ